MRRIRLLLLAVVTLGLAPGTFLRTPTGKRSDVAVVRITAMDERAGLRGSLVPTGVWEMTSRHGWFGGFSALVGKGASGLLAGSDRGWLLDIDLSGGSPRAVPGSFRFIGRAATGRTEVVDLESLARDPTSGTVWGAFENFNLVMRLAPGGGVAMRSPPEMAGWSPNSGPETMERLADGRFVIIAEGPERGSETDHEGLLFPRDPVRGGTPLRFRFFAAPDYDPVDAAQLPDGRVLILLRRVRYAIPARFDTAIAIADPREIRAGQSWRARIVERLDGGIFADNFEGITFVPDRTDPARGSVWVVSDDNFSIFQRTLLVRFAWNPADRPASPPGRQ
ncbi:MAG: esterase-like activity of phytase family protein [Porphyrobacter sp.]|nr:esterase-like activity of phytase family protein [Porphyrobacter sp.]